MQLSDSRSGYRFAAADITPETASRTRRQDPVLPKTAADSMPELSVVIVAIDDEQCTVLRALVDSTAVARTVHTCASFPVAASDPVTRRVRTANPDVTLVDIPADNPQVALRAIELLHRELPEAAIFASGNLNQPQIIVNAMRAGAREFIERPANTTDFLEAFVRLITAQGPIMSAQDFRRMITLERKRSECSRKPFMLLLMDMGDHLPSEKNGRILGKILSALSLSTRDTDVTGWYSNNCVVGVMFTEISIEEGGSTPSTIITRVTQTLQKNLTLEQFNRVTLSFHVFPEDWDEESQQGPTNRTLYPDLSRREDGRKLSRTLKRMMDIVDSSLATVRRSTRVKRPVRSIT